ncbi:recombinase family protein [Erythrobacter sp. EC-HK427]|uniref:recombinase family protein n=1 Tax=Erythrobacter sp. EC-HK427 TaxID=2038396 RepID=UPI00125280F6|nr:conserved hypothetical protein [Erythrobacter sp. EC-HK427]
MTDAILYARYSTAMQSQDSVEDQLRLLRERAEREGWRIIGEEADPAVSGTIRDRPGLTAAITAVDSGKARILLAESLDRISRDQEDLAGIFKRIRFAGAQIVTLSEGEVGSMHIGLGGTMSALFLEQLADKVRRGHVGRVKAGRVPGGLSYGYRKVFAFRDDGEPERGLREVDDAEAAIVKRIFEEYAAGDGATAIARRLNAEGIPSPRGGKWRANTIVGNRKRGNGILHNRLYIGEIVYNRQTFRKDPDTRKRVSRVNATADQVSQEVCELRIIDAETWAKVQARLDEGKTSHSSRRRKTRLFSGKLRCSCCGGPVIIISTDRWGCSAFRQTGTCSNGSTITDSVLQRRVWAAIKRDLLHPDVIAAYLEEFRLAWAEERRNLIAGRADFDRQLAEIDQQEDRIADAVIAGIAPDKLKAKADQLAARRAALLASQSDMPEIEPMIAHPAIIADYRQQIDSMAKIVAGDREAMAGARPLLDRLIDFIEVAPREGRQGVDLILHGELATILGLSAPQNTKAADPKADGNCMLKLVAGVGFEPTTFRL